jgi:hypothetical protein
MMSLVLSLILSASVAQPPDAVLPPPPPQPIVPPPPPSVAEFVANFKPLPGVYDVTVIHPVTCKPVNLCFKLPEGCPKVHCTKRSIEFEYACGCDVEIVFRLGGRVGVEYRN